MGQILLCHNRAPLITTLKRIYIDRRMWWIQLWRSHTGNSARYGGWPVCNTLAYKALHTGLQRHEVPTFRLHLKTHYFQLAYLSPWWPPPSPVRPDSLETMALYKFITYLLTYLQSHIQTFPLSDGLHLRRVSDAAVVRSSGESRRHGVEPWQSADVVV